MTERSGEETAPSGEGLAGAKPSRGLREVCFLIDARGAVLWSDAGMTAFALPDARARWEAIWERRADVVEIAHSHPLGPLAFSTEDETTMVALASALGKPMRFSIVAPVGMLARQDGGDRRVLEEPWWARLLRWASGMGGPREGREGEE